MNTCLIPSAGFGKRLGSPLAKEMLVDPKTRRPLIDWSIELALQNGLKPIVITREEKWTLIRHIQDQWAHKGAEIFLIEASKEWPDSILKCHKVWGEINLLLLPDTRFEPTAIIRHLVSDCRQNAASFAYFETVDSLSNWGVLDWQNPGVLKICEKPSVVKIQEKICPWGVIAFQKSFGKILFENLLESNGSHEWFKFEFSYTLHPLDFFKDLTRHPSDIVLP